MAWIINKYRLKDHETRQTLNIPSEFQFLKIDQQDNVTVLWFLVNTTYGEITLNICTYTDGEPLFKDPLYASYVNPPLYIKYLGTLHNRISTDNWHSRHYILENYT